MNKKLILLLSFVLTAFSVFGQISIIPQPSIVLKPEKPGNFLIDSKTPIVVSGTQLTNSANYLKNYLTKTYGVNLKTQNHTSASPAIFLQIEQKNDVPSGVYNLLVSKEGIYITGYDEAGVFYGVQSVLQLLPVTKTSALTVPYVTINDAPRFSYRGMHLDVSRHFFTVSAVKKYIDNLALHKFNYFHWHLTDDQGWRIEIKKYPKLTEVGSHRSGTIVGHHPGTGNDNIPEGGFYTQKEVKEVVKYAAERYVTVIPEIEMPGHASAALTAYPNLGCTGGPYQVQQTWGVFDEVFCAGNDTVFTFLQDVLDEVIPLFPAQYVHIGGDECPKTSWKACPKCQKRIKDNNLKDEHALQSYFISRMEKYVNTKGKSIIGWDEILEGGLAPNALVMSWRGEQGGIDAAKQKHYVMMTPGSHVYFDYSQSSRDDSLTIGGLTTVQKVYSYEPIQAQIQPNEEKYILGAQANVWTEYIPNEKKLEYMIFPRMSALSEVLWSPKNKRNWNDFETRLQKQFKRYDLWNVNYSKAYFDQLSTIPKAN
ncbi:MAG: beta-N-acetylhexosaminidase [Sphingobacteriales bacterium]|nr:beta-N-acetylhexosaminidase [Sphingobacteriales bacterium]